MEACFPPMSSFTLMLSLCCFCISLLLHHCSFICFLKRFFNFFFCFSSIIEILKLPWIMQNTSLTIQYMLWVYNLSCKGLCYELLRGLSVPPMFCVNKNIYSNLRLYFLSPFYLCFLVPFHTKFNFRSLCLSPRLDAFVTESFWLKETTQKLG